MATYWVQIIIFCCFFRFSLGCPSQKDPDPPECPATKEPECPTTKVPECPTTKEPPECPTTETPSI